MNELNQKPNDPRDYCRECNHTESRHTRRMFECGYVASFLSAANVEDACFCNSFVPLDNLEFLEYKLKQKEAEKLSI